MSKERNLNTGMQGLMKPMRPVIDRVYRGLYDLRHPEIGRLRTRISGIDNLMLPQKALVWIGKCSDLDMEVKADENAWGRKTGFDIINVQIKLLDERRLVKQGKGDGGEAVELRRRIGEELDGHFNYLVSDGGAFSNYEKERVNAGVRSERETAYSVPQVALETDPATAEFYRGVFGRLDSYHSAVSIEEKVGAFAGLISMREPFADSRFLALDSYLGIPAVSPYAGVNQIAFLNNLERLGFPGAGEISEISR